MKKKTPATKSVAKAHRNQNVVPGRAEKILSAAKRCFQRTGAATMVEDILREADISRTTFYRYFASVDAIVIEMAVTEAASVLTASVQAAVVSESDLPAQLSFVIAHMASRLFEPPMLRHLVDSGSTVRLANLVLSSGEALQVVSQPLLEILESGRRAGVLRNDLDEKEMAEWVLRNIWSLHSAPTPFADDIEKLQHYVRTRAMPGLLAPSYKPSDDLNPKIEMIRQSVERIEQCMVQVIKRG